MTALSLRVRTPHQLLGPAPQNPIRIWRIAGQGLDDMRVVDRFGQGAGYARIEHGGHV